jgi:Na+-driven multidrug efflux pump
VLILTAHTESGFSWSTEGIQLAILIALILVMAVAILVWRRSERMATARDRAER